MAEKGIFGRIFRNRRNIIDRGSTEFDTAVAVNQRIYEVLTDIDPVFEIMQPHLADDLRFTEAEQQAFKQVIAANVTYGDKSRPGIDGTVRTRLTQRAGSILEQAQAAISLGHLTGFARDLMSDINALLVMPDQYRASSNQQSTLLNRIRTYPPLR